ncbi:MAG: nuclear transport factor 2 family protein [Sphingosinicella sp.]|nr:nuclear transport factor 2 family protein [Sphingosinicella sp.]
MTAIENKRMISDIYTALEKGDRGPFGEACHPNYVWRFPGHCSWSRRFEGQESVRRDLIAPLFALFATEYTARVINLVAEGDQVVAEVRGDVITKAGGRYNNEYCFIFKFRDGKIIEIVEYCDTDLEERVLGKYEDAVAVYREKQAV